MVVLIKKNHSGHETSLLANEIYFIFKQKKRFNLLMYVVIRK
jgi:hypothetical protein